MTNRRYPLALIPTLAFALTGCQAMWYTTPAGPANMPALTESDIAHEMTRSPAAQFPARMAMVRVQAPGYRSYNCESYGSGKYSVVTARDAEKDADVQRIEKLPQVAALAPLNRMVIPYDLQTAKELRLAAASLKTDLLLVYTIDTSFRIEHHEIGPLQAIGLGFLPNKEAVVTATASAALFDVRTGYIYGLAESTAKETQIASYWTSQQAVDSSRGKAESAAFTGLVTEFEKTWKGVVDQYATKTAMAP